MSCTCTFDAVSPMQVAEAAVIAIPDKKWTERPLLVCVKAEGQNCTKDDILKFLKPRMSKWWLPGEQLQLCHSFCLCRSDTQLHSPGNIAPPFSPVLLQRKSFL